MVKKYPSPERAVITIMDDGSKIKLSVLFDCLDKDCPETFHTDEFYTYSEAASVMQGFANRFLDQAPIEGSA